MRTPAGLSNRHTHTNMANNQRIVSSCIYIFFCMNNIISIIRRWHCCCRSKSTSSLLSPWDRGNSTRLTNRCQKIGARVCVCVAIWQCFSPRLNSYGPNRDEWESRTISAMDYGYYHENWYVFICSIGSVTCTASSINVRRIIKKNHKKNIFFSILLSN